jgi:hypothetical protein
MCRSIDIDSVAGENISLHTYRARKSTDKTDDVIDGRIQFNLSRNAAPQPRPESAAQRRLKGVGCRRWFGSSVAPIVELVAEPLIA